MLEFNKDKNKNVYIFCVLIAVILLISTFISYFVVNKNDPLVSYKYDFADYMNSGFAHKKDGRTLPDVYVDEWLDYKANFSIDTIDELDVRYSGVIECEEENDARYVFKFSARNSYYKFSCMIKTENVGEHAKGASISFEEENYYLCDITGTTDWQEVTGYIKCAASDVNLTVLLRLGGHSSLNSGKVYFEQFKIEEVSSLPDGVDANNILTVKKNVHQTEYQYNIGYIFLFAAVVFILFIVFITLKKSTVAHFFHGENALFIILASAFAIRLIAAPFAQGFEGDVHTFKIWGDVMSNNFSSTLPRFYDQAAASGLNCDYPPLYMYLLGGISSLMKMLSVDFGSYAYKLAIKLPSLIADIITAIFIYKICNQVEQSEKGKWMKPSWKILFVSLYLFNPMVLFDSVVWGQVDSILAMFLIIAVYAIMNKKVVTSAALFGIALMIKPQALFAGPILLYFVLKGDFSQEKKEGSSSALAFKLAYILGLVSSFIFPLVRDSAILSGPYLSPASNYYNDYSLVNLLFSGKASAGEVNIGGIIMFSLPLIFVLMNLILLWLPQKFESGIFKYKTRYLINTITMGISAILHIFLFIGFKAIPDTMESLTGCIAVDTAGGLYFGFILSIVMLSLSLIHYMGDINNLFAKIKQIFVNFVNAGSTILLTIVLVTIPFTFENMFFITNLLKFSTNHYPMASVNGFNFFAFIGLNWEYDSGYNVDTGLFGISHYAWGMLFIAAIVIVGFILYMLLPKNYKAKPFLICLFLLTGIFCFSTRMHERYLFPALIFALIVAILDNSKFMTRVYWLLTTAIFFNSLWVLGRYSSNQNFGFHDNPFMMFIVSALYLAAFAYIIMYIVLRIRNCDNTKLLEEVNDL